MSFGETRAAASSARCILRTRTCSAWVRRARPTETLDASQHAGIPDSPYFEADAALTALYQAVANLPERQRLVFQLRYFDELPYADIASVLGTSEGGLKANYHHAVAKIKKQLAELNLDALEAS